MKEFYDTLKSIVSEVTSPRAHIQEITATLNSKGFLTVGILWSDGLRSAIKITEAQAQEPDAEFFLKSRLRHQRRNEEGANQ